MRRKVTAIAVMFALAMVAVVANVSPASAALPALFCKNVTGTQILADHFGNVPSNQVMNLCVSNQGGYQQAGVGLPTGTGYFHSINGNSIRVELVYYTFANFTSRGQALVQPSNAPFQNLTPVVSVTTPPVAWWYQGVFCARLYNMTANYWADFTCVDSDGTWRV
jgi:hypothetical protein